MFNYCFNVNLLYFMLSYGLINVLINVFYVKLMYFLFIYISLK